MRFDPLAPGLPRIAIQDWIARGTPRERTIPRATVIAAFASAMMDDRRVPPHRFDPRGVRTNTSISATSCTNASGGTSTTPPYT